MRGRFNCLASASHSLVDHAIQSPELDRQREDNGELNWGRGEVEDYALTSWSRWH